jgi:WD40 repeat protein
LTTDSGMCLMTYRGKLQGEVYVTANSDENRILARDMKGGYEIWNIETGECLISAHHKNHFFLGFSPDGMRIISTTDNGEISEWNTLTNKCEQTYNKNNPVGKAVTCLTYHPNGTKFLAAYDNIIHEWNTSIIDTICKSFSLERLRITSTTIEELKEHIDESKADGLYELEGEFSEKELQKILHEFHFDKQEISIIIEKASRVTNYEITQICYNPYGTRVLFAKEADPSVEEWDLISKRQTQKFECPQNVSCICYNKDGSRVAIGNAWIIDEFDVTGGEFLDRYDKHHQKVTSLSYGPGGETLLSAGEDGKIKEWNVMAGAQKKEKKTIDYKFGMLIQGLDLSQRHPDSEISEEEQKILEQYGVTF